MLMRHFCITKVKCQYLYDVPPGGQTVSLSPFNRRASALFRQN